jgi:small basic protein
LSEVGPPRWLIHELQALHDPNLAAEEPSRATTVLQLAGEESPYFLLEGHDDVYGVLANMGIGKPSRWQLYLTIASMVAVLNSVVGGTTVALVARLLDASIAVSVFIGGVALLVSLFLHDRVQRRTHVSSREIARPLFPTVANEKSVAKQARTIPRPTSS